MQLIPRPVERLIEEFGKLPGIGPRSAERLTFFLLRDSRGHHEQLGQALIELRENIRLCEQCHNLTDQTLCAICSNTGRDSHIIAIVEEPLDVIALEKTSMFKGRYHVLGGVISPIDGVGPDQLTISSLLDRIKRQAITEIILATNPSTEGETTALYIRRQLESSDLKVTRLARGLPVGGDLEYADQITLGRALQGRQAF